MKTKRYYILVLFCMGIYAHGQNPASLPVTLLTNEYTTTTLFFPSQIAKVVDPAGNYTFEHGDIDPKIGLLKGKKGPPSNMIVITENGYIYSFALQYSENVEIFNFMLTPDMAIGRTANENSTSGPATTGDTVVPEMPLKTAKEDDIDYPENTSVGDLSHKNPALGTIPDEIGDNGSEGNSASHSIYPGLEHNGQGDLYHIDREEYYRIFCENNYLQKTIFRRTFRQNKRVVLKLNNILVDRNEMYFVLQVENNSKREYKVNGLSFFHKRGVGQIQKIMKPSYVFNLQDTIDPQSINEVVFVFKRFTISGKEAIYVVLDELENNRMVMLPLDNTQINAPTN
ncbi:MAG TPA: DUF4138 domain-containing protein [Pricia sp.]|nr:DUF4138 domain-containing protein [Pricia sp.]